MVAVPVATPPPFAAKVEHVARTDVRFSWRPGCPVGPTQLRRIRLGYWGFDGTPHSGEIVVNAAVTGAVTGVFRKLYSERFPIRRLQPVDVYRGSDERSMAADNTSGFNCRYAVAPGPKSWSVHAYGEAIDVNPVENPYLEGGKVRPPAGAAFTGRKKVRPGMAVPGGALVQAFAVAGWPWGGRWTASPDYQHFSSNGR
jgi:D-alanyl-D-alanine carboxypeptidase